MLLTRLLDNNMADLLLLLCIGLFTVIGKRFRNKTITEKSHSLHSLCQNVYEFPLQWFCISLVGWFRVICDVCGSLQSEFVTKHIEKKAKGINVNSNIPDKQ